MSDDRYESIAQRLAAIEEELRDLAYERLADAARAGADPEAEAAAADEKRLLQARRAITRAIHALGVTPSEADPLD